MRPRVTVVCPAYQRSRAIARTVESVLRQTVSDVELLVVSDGSTDDTDDVVRELAATDDRVRLLRLAHTGNPSIPRNCGLAQARGDVVAYIDHDDEWRADHLQTVLALLERAPIAATGCERVEASKATPLPVLGSVWHPEIQVADPMFEPSRVAHRAGLVEGAGGWRSDGAIGLEDWDLWLRLTDAGHRFATSSEPTVSLATGPGTRRNAVASNYHVVLGRYPVRGQADAAAVELASARWSQQLSEAARADIGEWYHELAASLDFCWPATGLAPSGDRLGAEIDQAIEVAFDAEGSPGRRHHATPRVAVAAGATGYGVVLPLWCMTAHHAQRAAAIIHRRHRRQLAQLRGILADHAARRTARTPMTAVSKTSSSSISALSANGVLR